MTISAPEAAPERAAGFERETARIATAGRASATVHPFSPGFAISPGHSDCLLLDPAGTIARFTMTPHEAGTFDVSADVRLYKNDDCSGTPIPRPATTLRVEVTVNQGGLVRSHLGELWTIFWAEALGFWKWLVGFLFLAVIAVVRKRMAQHRVEPR